MSEYDSLAVAIEIQREREMTKQITMSNHWQGSFDRHLILSQVSMLIKVEQDKLALIRIEEKSQDLPDEMDQLSYHTGRLWALEDFKAQIETNNKVIEVVS